MSRKPRLPTLAFGISPIISECQRQFGVDPIYAQIKLREVGSRGRLSYYVSFHIKGSLTQLEEDFTIGRKQLELEKDLAFESWMKMMFTPFVAREFIDVGMCLIAGWDRHDAILQPTMGPLGNLVHSVPCNWYEPRIAPEGTHLEGMN